MQERAVLRGTALCRSRTGRRQLARIERLLPENGSSQHQNLAWAGLFIQNVLDSGTSGCRLSSPFVKISRFETPQTPQRQGSKTINRYTVPSPKSLNKSPCPVTPCTEVARSIHAHRCNGSEGVQGYLAHKKTPTPLGPPQGPRHTRKAGS